MNVLTNNKNLIFLSFLFFLFFQKLILTISGVNISAPTDLIFNLFFIYNLKNILNEKIRFSIFILIAVSILQNIYHLVILDPIDGMRGGRELNQMIIYFVCFYYYFKRVPISANEIRSLNLLIFKVFIFTLMLEFLLTFYPGILPVANFFYNKYRALNSTLFQSIITKFDASIPNSIFLGAQFCAVLSLSGLFIFSINSFYQKKQISGFVFLFSAFVLSLFSLNITSLVCALVLVISYLIIWLNFMKEFRKLSYVFLSVVIIGIIFFLLFKPVLLLRLQGSKIFYYIESFYEPIRVVINSDLGNFLFGHGTAISRGAKMKLVSQDFGLGVIFYTHGVLAPLSLIGYIASLFLSATKKIKESRENIQAILFCITIVVIFFVSLIHYKTVFTTGLRQYFILNMYFLYQLIYLERNQETKLSPQTKEILLT